MNRADAIQPSDLVDARDSDVAPEPDDTHYIVAFAPIFRGKAPRRQQAACGTYVETSRHSNEPTCDQCAAWLEQEAESEAETFASLGYVQVNGFWVPKEA